MDFALSPKAAELAARLEDFMRDLVYPAEPVYREQMAAAGTPHYQPPVLEELKQQARTAGCGTCSCRTRPSGPTG